MRKILFLLLFFVFCLNLSTIQTLARCSPAIPGHNLKKGNCDPAKFSCRPPAQILTGDQFTDSRCSSPLFCCELVNTGIDDETRFYSLLGTPPPGIKTTPGCDSCQWCQFQTKPSSWTDCDKCVSGEALKDVTNTKHPGVWTALGCVHTEPEDFVAQLLGWVIGLGGGIAFLLIVYGGFQIVISTGDPEKLNSGKEIIVSALTGLLMIVFSVILLRIIGVDILQIPGFKK